MMTQKGLDFVLSARDYGPLVYLKYFVPIYDDRFDSDVRTSGTLSAYSDIADINATQPYGEKLWNVTGTYEVVEAGNYIISANTYAPNSIQNSYQRTTVRTNLLDGQPLSNQIYAHSWSATPLDDNFYNWSTTGTGEAITANTDKLSPAPEDMYTINNYYPVYDKIETTNLRGSFKCILDENTGSIKFNKIALYAAQIQGSTIISHCYFGEAYLGSSPAIRSSLGQGYDKFEFDIQIDISGVDATFDDIFFSSSADYWSRSPGGLYYPNRIGIGMFDDNVKEIKASLHLKRTREDIAANIPLLKLNYDNDKYTDINIVSTSYDVTNTNPITSAGGGDIVLSFCSNTIGQYPSYIGDAIAIRPYIGSTYTLGTSASQFRELHLKNPVIITKDTSSKIPLVINNQMKNYAVNINDGQVYLGNISGSLNTTSADPFGIRLNNIGVNIVTTTTATNADPRGSFKGGDLWRDGHDLLIYNTSANGTESIYMFAGLKMTGTDAITAVGGATHKNILSEIEKTSHHLFCDSNLKLSNTAEIKIGAKGKLGLYGPIELGNSNDDAKNTAIIRTTIDDDGNGDYRLFIGAGLLDTISMTAISNTVNNIIGGSSENFEDMLHNDSKLFLIANEINIDSSIVPIQNNTDSLGTSAKMFTTSFVKHAYFGNTEVQPQLGLFIGNISGFGTSDADFGIIKLGTNENDCEVQIGQSGDPINYGYFGNIGSTATPVNNGYFTNIGSQAIKVDYGYFTNLYATNIGSTATSGYFNNIITTNIQTQFIGIPNPVFIGYFANISADNILAQSGYSEYGRTENLGSWITVSAASATCPQYSAVSADFDYNIVGKMLTCIGEIYLSSSDSSAISFESIILNYFTTLSTTITISKAIGHFYTDKIDITATEQYGNISNMGNVIIFKCKDFSMTKCDSIKFTFIAKLT